MMERMGARLRGLVVGVMGSVVLEGSGVLGIGDQASRKGLY